MQLHSGIFAVRGEGSTRSSFIHTSNTIGNFTNNPYGRRYSISYGVAAQIQRIVTNNNSIGLQFGWKMLRNSVLIDRIDEIGIEARGKTILRNVFVNLHPFIGHRFINTNIIIDLSADPEFGLCLISQERGEARETGIHNGQKYLKHRVGRT